MSATAEFSAEMATAKSIAKSGEIIGAIAAGRLAHKVFLYLDWDRFTDLVHNAGARFNWSSEKDTRRMLAEPPARRSAIIRGRLAQIYVDDIRSDITDPDLVQMPFDGKSPKTVIEHTLAMVRHIANPALGPPQ
jgi:hypothetical protein